MKTAIESLRKALASRYAIQRELGQGGIATVYLAHDEKPTTGRRQGVAARVGFRHRGTRHAAR